MVQLVCASHCEQSRVSVEWPRSVSSLYGDPAGLERRWIGQYGAGRVRHRRSLPRQHCVRVAGRQGVCTGTAAGKQAGKQAIQQRTELAEDRVGHIHSRGRVRPGRGGNGHGIVDKQRLLRSRLSDPAAKPNCANCGQRERHTQRRSGQWPASIRNRKHVPEQGDNSSNSAEAPSASDSQVTPVTMLVKNHNRNTTRSQIELYRFAY